MEIMEDLLDVRGRKRSPATLPGFHAGKIPATKGRTFPPDPMRIGITKAIWSVPSCRE